MADELRLLAAPAQAGATVVAQVFAEDGSQIGGDIACAEPSTAVFVGDMPAAAAGLYGVRFLEGTTHVGYGCLMWDGTTEVSDLTVLNGHVGINAGIGAVPVATRALMNPELARLDVDVSSRAETVDVSGLATPADITAAQVALVAEHDATQVAIAAIEPADISGLATSVEVQALNNVSTADLDAALASYDGPTDAEFNAGVAAIQTDIAAIPTTDISALATSADVAALNNVSTTDLDAALQTYDGPTGAELTAGVAAIQADIAAIPAADLSGVATSAQVDALNDLSVAEVTAAIDAYDAPTKAELDAGLAALPSDTDVAAAVRSDLSVELTRLDVDVSSRAEPISLAGLATSADIGTLTSEHAATQAAVAALPTPLSLAQLVAEISSGTSGLATAAQVQAVDTAVSGLDLSALATLVQYHDSEVRFVGADGTTEVLQPDAFEMVMLDTDGVSVVKRISFRAANGTPTSLQDATRYVRVS